MVARGAMTPGRDWAGGATAARRALTPSGRPARPARPKRMIKNSSGNFVGIDSGGLRSVSVYVGMLIGYWTRR